MKQLSTARLAVIVICLSLLAAGTSFFAWSRQPARGVVLQNEKGTDVKGSSSTQEYFETSLFITKAPSNLKMKVKNEVASPSILGQYLLADKDVYISDQLAITIGVATNNDISQVSPVQFRRTQPQEYTETALVSGFPEGSISFIKESDFEKSIFWIQGGKYVAVVVSGGIQNRADLEESLRVVVSNWQWK